MEKTLYLVRGLPGAGKTTLASSLAPRANVSADEFFTTGGEYKFVPRLLKDAHEWCQISAAMHMASEEPVVVVHNTFTTEKEMEPYFEMAKKLGYRVATVIVENRQRSVSVHGVPEATMEKMKNRFSIDLG